MTDYMVAAQKRSGMSAQRREELRKFNEAQEDWHSTCRWCGKKLYGSLRMMREHVDGCSPSQ